MARRKNIYEVRTYPGRRLVSRHYKLSVARKVAKKSDSYRVCNQDGRWYS